MSWNQPREKVKNQAGETTCGPNAMAAIAELYFERLTGKYTKFSPGSISALQLNPNPKLDGLSPFEIGEVLIQYGIAEYEILPYDRDDPEIYQCVKDKDALIQNAAKYRFKAFQHISTVEEIREALKLCPVMIGMPIFRQFSSLNRYNYTIQTKNPESDFTGWHIVAIIDDAPEEGCFRILNSYGPNWGLGGTALMPYDYFPQFPLTKIVSFTPYEEVKDLVVKEQLLFRNRSHEPLAPRGIVIHSTDTPGATAQNEYVYFNTGERGASAHYFVDWAEIIRTIPENEQAWHAGPTANRRFLSVEMCEPKGTDPAKFSEVWNKTVWLVADACKRYGWTSKEVFSHRGISALYGETDHTDPIGFLARYGKTWDDLLNAIDKEIGGNKVDKAILIFSEDDFPAAKRLMGKEGNIPVIFRNPDATAPSSINSVKHLFIVGGSSVGHPNETVLAGADWFATAAAVKNYLG